MADNNEKTTNKPNNSGASGAGSRRPEDWGTRRIDPVPADAAADSSTKPESGDRGKSESASKPKKSGKEIAKIIVIVLAAIATVAAFSFLLVFALNNKSTSTDTTTAHVHSYGNWVTLKAATCSEEGKQQRTCACGDKETQSIPTTAHTIVTTTGKAATCTEAGLSDGQKCSVCNKVIVKQVELPATGHDFVNGVCTRCGATEDNTTFIFSSNGNETCSLVGIDVAGSNNIVVPDISPSGDAVISIGDYAFTGNTDIISVALPESVTYIGRNAFAGCTSLTQLTFSSTLTEIAADALSGCTSLTAIELPEGLLTIGDRAFSGCSGLAELTIPDSVTSLGEAALSGCSGLRELTLPIAAPAITAGSAICYRPFGYYFGTTAYDGSVMYSQNYTMSNSTITYSRDYYFPASLASVTVTVSTGRGAFNNLGLISEIILAEGVTDMETDTFRDCRNLKVLDLPASLINMAEGCLCIDANRLDISFAGTVAQLRELVTDGCLSEDTTYLIFCSDGTELFQAQLPIGGDPDSDDPTDSSESPDETDPAGEGDPDGEEGPEGSDPTTEADPGFPEP